MLYEILPKGAFLPALVITSFLLSFAALKFFMRLLPKDHGRQFAVNGALSEGKPRGAGIIMITVFTLLTALFVPLDAERAIYLALIFAAMLTGYLDDAAEKPWGELKKGLLDLAITIALTADFMYFNTTDITVFSKTLHIPQPLFAVLCAVLVWASINVTNCCDGVDGMCASLSICALSLFMLNGAIEGKTLDHTALIMIMVLLSYLWFNCSPSRVLMGDAGSRAIGVLLAVTALRSGDPFLFIFYASVIIVDGGLGLLKLSVRRFLKIKNFMENIRTPIHDHWRKNLGVGDTQVTVRFVIIQLIIGLSAMLILHA